MFVYRPRALAPVAWAVTHHMAWNQRRRELRVPWKMVPAVTET
jgi:hypothetical protein